MISSIPTVMQQNHYLNNALKANDKDLVNIENLSKISEDKNLSKNKILKFRKNLIDLSVLNTYDVIGVLQITDASLKNITQKANKLYEVFLKINDQTLNSNQKTMLKKQVQHLQESIYEDFNHADYKGKNTFKTLNFILKNTKFDILKKETIGIDKENDTSDFINEIAKLRDEIASGIHTMTSNFHAKIENSIKANAKKEIYNENIDKSKYLKENMNVFYISQANAILQSKIAMLLE